MMCFFASQICEGIYIMWIIRALDYLAGHPILTALLIALVLFAFVCEWLHLVDWLRFIVKLVRRKR